MHNNIHINYNMLCEVGTAGMHYTLQFYDYEFVSKTFIVKKLKLVVRLISGWAIKGWSYFRKFYAAMKLPITLFSLAN